MPTMVTSKLHKNQIASLGNNRFLLCLESHGSDDYAQTSVWSHYNGHTHQFNFSNNIKMLAAHQGLNACAVIIEKIDPNIPETIEVSNGEKEWKITF